jgi:hypothetical protein
MTINFKHFWPSLIDDYKWIGKWSIISISVMGMLYIIGLMTFNLLSTLNESAKIGLFVFLTWICAWLFIDSIILFLIFLDRQSMCEYCALLFVGSGICFWICSSQISREFHVSNGSSIIPFVFNLIWMLIFIPVTRAYYKSKVV